MSELQDLVSRHVQRLGRKAGLDVRRRRPPEPRRQRLLENERIDLVLDVGAHTGEYGRALRRNGYRGRIVSFEPERSNFEQLAQQASADPSWQIEQIALSEEDGEAQLGVADVFSSLLPVTERLTSVFERARPATQQTVPLRRLDGIDGLTAEIADSRTLIKLDVQGHELSALRGAEDSLARIRMVEIELSVVALYEGQPMMIELMKQLDSEDFQLVDLEPIGRDRNTGQFMQFDGIFLRR